MEGREGRMKEGRKEGRKERTKEGSELGKEEGGKEGMEGGNKEVRWEEGERKERTNEGNEGEKEEGGRRKGRRKDRGIMKRLERKKKMELNRNRCSSFVFCRGFGFRFLLLKSFNFLSLLVTPCILVTLSPFLGWNYYS